MTVTVTKGRNQQIDTIVDSPDGTFGRGQPNTHLEIRQLGGGGGQRLLLDGGRRVG